MFDCNLMAIATDDRFLQLLRWQLQDHEDGASLIVAGTFDAACALLAKVRPRLIVVHWGRGGPYEAPISSSGERRS